MPPHYGECCVVTADESESHALLLPASPLLLLCISLVLLDPKEQLQLPVLWKGFGPLWRSMFSSLRASTTLCERLLQGCSNTSVCLHLWRSVSRANSEQDTKNCRHFIELSNFKMNIAICINYYVISFNIFSGCPGQCFKGCCIVKVGWS